MVWGARSRGQVDTTHPDIQKVSERVDSRWSSTALQGRRDLEEQRANVEKGVSKTLESKHLLEYSSEPDKGVDAIDIAPDPLKWPQLKAKMLEIDRLLEALGRDGLDRDDRRELSSKIRAAMSTHAKELGRWYAFAGYYHGVADEMYERGEISAPMRHGYDWNGNHQLDDQSFDDLPHHERVSSQSSGQG